VDLHWAELYEDGEFLEFLGKEQLLADGFQHRFTPFSAIGLYEAGAEK